MIAIALSVAPASAQMFVDGALFAQRFEKRPVYGPGAALHFAFYNYALELVVSGGYYVTPENSSDSWDVRLDSRVNLPSLYLIRPYAGVGYARTVTENTKTSTGIVVAGTYLGFLLGRRIHPFLEGEYRAAAALGDFRFRAGLRFQFRDP